MASNSLECAPRVDENLCAEQRRDFWNSLGVASFGSAADAKQFCQSIHDPFQIETERIFYIMDLASTGEFLVAEHIKEGHSPHLAT